MKSMTRRPMPGLIVTLILTTAIATEFFRPQSTSAGIVATAGCAPLDSLAIDLKDELVDLMGRTDPMADTILIIRGIARVPTAQIAIITDPGTCVRAANAYSGYVSISDPDRLVHAIRAGIRYLVIDPHYLNGPNNLGVTFDSSFTQKIASFNY